METVVRPEEAVNITLFFGKRKQETLRKFNQLSNQLRRRADSKFSRSQFRQAPRHCQQHRDVVHHCL